MRMSLMKGYTTAEPTEVKTLQEVAHLITKTDWSAGVFKEEYREAANFLGSDLMPIDIDEGMTITEAKETFKDYAHVIATTRSHQKEKNGVIADRFRVVLLLDKPIQKEADYAATYKSLCGTFPCIDPSCSDGSRLYYKSVNVVSVNERGSKVEPVHFKPHEPQRTVELGDGERGKLSKEACNFFIQGPQNGSVNLQLFKACKEAQQNGYTQEWVIKSLDTMIKSTGNWGSGHVNKVDMKTIKSAFSKEAKHQPRVIKDDSPLKFMKMKELKKESQGMSWTVERFLTDGGLSIWAGEPKAGKSTIVRQLCLALSRGDEFLGRATQKCSVLYMALEEQIEIIDEQFTKQGLTDDDAVFIHAGPVGIDDPIAYIKEAISGDEVKFLVVDTLALLLNVDNLNNYSQVNRAITPYRTLARETGTHIMFIHHANKNVEGSKTNKIMGSNALFGSVDNAIIFERGNPTRFLTSFQRGGEAFMNHPLKYHEETLTYELLEVKRDVNF